MKKIGKWHFVGWLCLCGISRLFAQEITSFEIMDNAAVGLSVAPFEKYGMAVADIDRNGYPDILCIRWKSPGFSRIYTNQNGIFKVIANQAAVETIESAEANTRTSLWVDFDNDGDRDLSISTDKGIHLLRNDNNVFTDISTAVGFVGKVPPGFISSWVYTIGGWADYDLDGDLDCVIAQENNKNLYLFRNDKAVFTNVAEQAGLNATVLAGSGNLSWMDFDLDGDPDLYSATKFFRNDNGVFTDVTEAMGLSALTDVSQRELFDYDNDGDMDFFKSVGDATAAGSNEMWENRNGLFTNVTAEVGLILSRDRYRGMTIGDFDNDGDKDIFLQLNIDPSPDYLLVNDEPAGGGRAFENVAEFARITKTGDRKGSAFLDYDMDGFLDIYLPSAEHNHILYHNLADNGANWIGFILEGVTSNRDAVGSLVTVYTGGEKQICYTICGNGNLRQDNPNVHFGIGLNSVVDSVVIRWPLGTHQVLSGLAINTYHKIKEPDATKVVDWSTKNPVLQTCHLDQNFPNPFNPSTCLAFHMSKQGHIRLDVYDVTGKKLMTLVDGCQARGDHRITWNGKDSQGRKLAAGIYFLTLTAADVTETRKMVLVQ
jgi:hypothetical protein